MSKAKLEQALEIVYGVEGVLGARVWEADGIIAVGVRAGPAASPHDVLRRVEAALGALRAPGERWELGLIGEDDLIA